MITAINTIIIQFQKHRVVMICTMFSLTFSGTVNLTAIWTAMTSKAIQVSHAQALSSEQKDKELG